MKAKSLLFALAMPLAVFPAHAQSGQAQPAQKLFQSGADIPALIAQAKANQKSSTANSIMPIVTLAPYRVQLEYRTGLTPPTLHHGEAELVEVLQGAADLATGGQLTGVKPPRPGSSTEMGTGIAGASKRHIVKGDYVMIPPETPHQFQGINGEFVIMSVHLLMPPK